MTSKLYGRSDPVVYLGVDSGTKGYLCLYDPAPLEAMPPLQFSSMPRRKGRICVRQKHRKKDAKAPDYDPAGMAALLDYAMSRHSCLVVVIEEPLVAMFGGKANGKAIMDLHRAYGMWNAICDLRGLPFFSIHPTTWKHQLKIFGMAKEQSLVRAAELMPEFVFDIVDAADSFLIAYAARALRLGIE